MDSGTVLVVIAVDMSMEQVLGLILVYQFQKGFKAPMGRIGIITQAERRSMGHHDIHTLGTPQGETELADPAAHLFFGVLMGAGVIAAAAAQA